MTFADFQDEFLDWIAGIVWCTVTTVDDRGRPRSRVLHPIWEVIDDAPVGCVVTSKTPVKTRHIAANPHVACMYWSPAQNTVAIDATASWVEDTGTKRHVFDLFNATPPPLGYDLGGFGDDGPANPLFEPLQLDARRVQLLRAEHMWRWTSHPAPGAKRAAEDDKLGGQVSCHLEGGIRATPRRVIW